MSVFKTACRVLFRHPVYLIIYVLYLGLMGIFVTANIETDEVGSTAFSAEPVTIAIVNRDDNAFTDGLVNALQERADVANDVADDRQQLQDIIAKGAADCLVIIPNGFGASFVEAARAGDAPPEIETAVATDTVDGLRAESLVNTALTCAALELRLDPDASVEEAAAAARASMERTVKAHYTARAEEASPLPPNYLTYCGWIVYPIICAFGVVIVMMLRDFNSGDVRRRNLTAPLSSLRLSLSLAAACAVLFGIVFLWLFGLGVVARAGSLVGVDAWRIALCGVALLTFCLFGLAFGFLLSQCGIGELMANALANIIGLMLSFLGGAWIDITLMAPGLKTIAMFTPVYWYEEALQTFATAPDATASALAPACGALGVVLLFALVIFVAALLVGRIRLSQSKLPAYQAG